MILQPYLEGGAIIPEGMVSARGKVRPGLCTSPFWSARARCRIFKGPFTHSWHRHIWLDIPGASFFLLCVASLKYLLFVTHLKWQLRLEESISPLVDWKPWLLSTYTCFPLECENVTLLVLLLASKTKMDLSPVEPIDLLSLPEAF